MSKSSPRFPKARLDALIEEAIVDAHGDDEQLVGFLSCLEDELGTPFSTRILGVEAEVVRIESGYRDDILAVCHNRQGTIRIPVLELPVPDPLPRGWEWIEAFRSWSGPR